MLNAEYKINNVFLTVSYRNIKLDLEKIISNLRIPQTDTRFAREISCS